MSTALRGLRVVDLSTLLAGPQVSAVLADFGADVVKVEPPAGDPLLRLGAQRAGRSLPYVLANRGKRVVTVDPTTATGLEESAALTGCADVVVTNQPLELLQRWQCSPDELLARNPAVVVVTVSCFGTDGPLADQPGNGSLAEAFAGITHLTGEADGPPILTSAALGDSLVGMSGALCALAACWHRDAGGGAGQHVDVTMYEPLIALLGPAVAAWAPGDPAPMRSGSRVDGGVPRNVYRCGDGTFVVVSGVTDAQVARILTLIGADDAASLQRFAASAQRLIHADELDALVAAWIGARPRDDVLAALAAARVPAVPVNTLTDLAAHPQVVARGSLVQVDDPVAGPVTLPGPVGRLRRTPAVVGPAPVASCDLATVLDGWATR
jgi:crotonobetainyl-CoA:carnitine CoA-transferase CaiB-like acyl-CoA transferase